MAKLKQLFSLSSTDSSLLPTFKDNKSRVTNLNESTVSRKFNRLKLGKNLKHMLGVIGEDLLKVLSSAKSKKLKENAVQVISSTMYPNHALENNLTQELTQKNKGPKLKGPTLKRT